METAVQRPPCARQRPRRAILLSGSPAAPAPPPELRHLARARHVPATWVHTGVLPQKAAAAAARGIASWNEQQQQQQQLHQPYPILEGQEEEGGGVSEEQQQQQLSEHFATITPLEVAAPAYRKTVQSVARVPTSDLDLDVLGAANKQTQQQQQQQPNKPLTKKQMRQNAKSNKNKRTKGRNRESNPYGTGVHTVNLPGAMLAGNQRIMATHKPANSNSSASNNKGGDSDEDEYDM
mmetsp:Transcript_32090/g.62770  ORF Transcript_32090/g.62770 Transcript_32090/m.62770 type:complete len:236 (-) Transcript_32090:15-722(-)